jgi:hypothetical protein
VDWGDFQSYGQENDPNPNWGMAASPSPLKKAKLYDIRESPGELRGLLTRAMEFSPHATRVPLPAPVRRTSPSAQESNPFSPRESILPFSGPVCKVYPVQTPPTIVAGEWNLCGTFLAADGGDPWAKALLSTGQEGWAKSGNSQSTGQKSLTQKCTAHQGNCGAKVRKRRSCAIPLPYLN